MPNIISSRTRRRYQRPLQQPIGFNTDSPQAKNLVGFWPLNQPFVYQDYSAGQRHMAQVDVASTIIRQLPGPDGGLAYDNPDGVSSYIRVGSSPLSATFPATLACWFTYTSVPTARNMVSHTGTTTAYNTLDLNTTGAVRAISAGGPTGETSASSTTTAVANQWHHAAAVFTSATSRAAYLNGSGKGTNATSKTGGAGSAFCSIGAFTTGASHFGRFIGSIAHVCIWNRALSDAEVFQLWDTDSRWELYYPLHRKVYAFGQGVAGGTAYVGDVTLPAAGGVTAAGGAGRFAALTLPAAGAVAQAGLAEAASAVALPAAAAVAPVGLAGAFGARTESAAAAVTAAGAKAVELSTALDCAAGVTAAALAGAFGPVTLGGSAAAVPVGMAGAFGARTESASAAVTAARLVGIQAAPDALAAAAALTAARLVGVLAAATLDAVATVTESGIAVAFASPAALAAVASTEGATGGAELVSIELATGAGVAVAATAGRQAELTLQAAAVLIQTGTAGAVCAVTFTAAAAAAAVGQATGQSAANLLAAAAVDAARVAAQSAGLDLGAAVAIAVVGEEVGVAPAGGFLFYVIATQGRQYGIRTPSV